MFYSDKVKKAIKIAYEAHAGQTDQAGYPYFLHPYHLAEQMSDEDSTVVALLHDVVEDTTVTLDDLRHEGFGERVIKALSLLTHVKSVPYLDYVARIAKDPLARRVKIADLRHNCDIHRGADTPYFRRKREDCYYPALRMLLAAEGSLRGAADVSDACPGESLGKISFLVQDERLQDRRSALLKMLREDGFCEWHAENALEKGSLLYVNLNTKTYSFDRYDVPLSEIIGGKAISCDEFIEIYRIYRPTDRHARFLVYQLDLEKEESRGTWRPVEGAKPIACDEYEPAEITLERALNRVPSHCVYDLSLLEGFTLPPETAAYLISADGFGYDALYYAVRMHFYIPLPGEKELYCAEVYKLKNGVYTLGRAEKEEILAEDEWQGDIERYVRGRYGITEENASRFEFSRDLPKGISESKIPSDDYLVFRIINEIVLEFPDGERLSEDACRIYFTKIVE